MKFLNILFIMLYIFMWQDILATEKPLFLPAKHISTSHNNAHELSSASPRSIPSPNLPRAIIPPQPEANREILERTERYTKGSMSFSDALSKAMREATQEKETALEKKLRSLGCMCWDEISVITPHLLQSVEMMRDPNKGPFILASGPRIRYLSDKYLL